MRGLNGSGLAATIALSLALAAAPARAEVTASDVLTWCDGATQPGQLGAINAFRCVNYLQGAADMVDAMTDAHLTSCLNGGQSAGAQLMARFIPALKGRVAEGAINDMSVAAQIADWLAGECGMDLTAVAAVGSGSQQPIGAGQADAGQTVAQASATETDALRVALDEARADADGFAARMADLEQALEIAVTGQSADLAVCSASLDRATMSLATAEAQAADNGMRVSELELELEAVNAEAIARRQEITEAEDRIAGLSDELNAAFSDQLVAEEALSRTTREAGRLAAIVDEVRIAADTARNAIVDMEQRVAQGQIRLAEAEARVVELDASLAGSREAYRLLEGDLARTGVTASERGAQIAALEEELGACRTIVASADTPAVVTPPQPPSRAAAPTPPNVVTTPSPLNGNNGANASPRPLDALALQSLRQMQQIVLRTNGVGARQVWSGPGGRHSGVVEVLREGFDGPDFCRELYSLARSGAVVVHESTELFCQYDGLWVFMSGT